MQINKTRALLIISSLLTFLISLGLLSAFVLVCFEGMVNSFAYFGVLANFTEIMGAIGLSCLLFGLFAIKLGFDQFKISRMAPYYYRKNKYKLVISFVIYLALIIVGAFCMFESYNDLSAVGQAFVSANIGYFGLGLIIASAFALMFVVIDMFTFEHDVKNGLIKIEHTGPLLLSPPEYKMVYSNNGNTYDYTKLELKIRKLNELKSKGIVTDDEYLNLKKEVIDNFFN